MDGQGLLQAQIYDGSEKGQKVYETTAFIGKPVAPGTEDKLEAPAKEKGLAGLVSWPVSIGYFESKGGDLTPSYQIDFRLYANGVSRELLIDYGDFSVHGTLTSLEYLKAAECRDPRRPLGSASPRRKIANSRHLCGFPKEFGYRFCGEIPPQPMGSATNVVEGWGSSQRHGAAGQDRPSWTDRIA